MNLSTLHRTHTNKKHTIGYKFILSLIVSFVGLINFGYCSYNFYSFSTSYVQAGETKYFPSGGMNCLLFKSSSCLNNAELLDSNGSLITGMAISQMLCFNGTGQYTNNYTSRCSIDLWNISVPSCPSQYTSEECQTEYGLITSGSLNECISDLNNCQSNTTGFNDLLNNCSNNLNACNNSLTSCLQQNCPETITGTNRSSLFINNIQYPGAPTIKFTIPEEIERDQYTDEEETNIDVIGYAYDQEKMQKMVNTQHYTPTGEEMSQLVEKIADFLPLIAVALLVIRMRRVLKKVFRF